MEMFLLWADDLDDAVGALRHLAPRIVGFVIALVLFAATGFALIHAPHATLLVAAGVLCATLVQSVRRRRRSATVARD